MELAAKIAIGFVAFIHLYIVWLEMFAWTTRGPKSFGRQREGFYEETKVLVGNQGLYNGFLAAGLIWSLLITNAEWHVNVALFFLGCVAVAGLYGAATASKKILFIQTIPAAIGIALVLAVKYA